MKLPALGNIDTSNLARYDYLLLVPILALAFYIAFMPHQDYPFPVHIDEWAHLAYQKAMLEAGSITFLDPFYGRDMLGFTHGFETGHDLFWSVFHSVSGISWMTIYRYFPGVVLMLTVLSVYILAKRQGFGWEAAFFTCLIPTTVGIMGPAFLVPIALGLLFIVLSLFVAFNCRGVWSYIVLFIFTSVLLTIHAATALGLVIILAPYVIINLKSDFKHSLGMMLALGAPCLIPLIWISGALLSRVAPLLSPQTPYGFVDYPRIIHTYGYLPVALCLIGTFLLAIRGGKRNYGLALGLLVLLLMLAVFYTLHYGIPIVYDRGLMWMLLMVAIVTGAGLMGVKRLRLPATLRAPAPIRNIGYILCVALVALTLYIGIPARHDLPYYHMIGDKEYAAFVWIRDNVPDEYDKAILDPWQGTPFTAITGKKVYTKIHSYPKEGDEKAAIFLREGCRDTDFLREQDISIIYTEGECRNPDLVEVSKNIYLLKEAPDNE